MHNNYVLLLFMVIYKQKFEIIMRGVHTLAN